MVGELLDSRERRRGRSCEQELLRSVLCPMSGAPASADLEHTPVLPNNISHIFLYHDIEVYMHMSRLSPTDVMVSKLVEQALGML